MQAPDSAAHKASSLKAFLRHALQGSHHTKGQDPPPLHMVGHPPKRDGLTKSTTAIATFLLWRATPSGVVLRPRRQQKDAPRSAGPQGSVAPPSTKWQTAASPPPVLHSTQDKVTSTFKGPRLGSVDSPLPACTAGGGIHTRNVLICTSHPTDVFIMSKLLFSH